MDFLSSLKSSAMFSDIARPPVTSNLAFYIISAVAIAVLAGVIVYIKRKKRK